MLRKPSTNYVIAGLALLAALVLTVARPSPEGLITVGMGDQEVRAAPGTLPTVTKHPLSALNVVNKTLIRVQDAYVDPSRIDPKEMLYSALDSVQFDIPEVMIEPNRAADEVVVQVNDKRQSFSTSEADSIWRMVGKLKRIFRFIEANMNPGADLAQVEYAAINGMLRTLDPHSVLLDPETAREMDINTSGQFGGLGIVIRVFKGKLTIVRPMKGTPAWDAGLKSGDHIYKINDELTENLTLQEAVNRMRGKVGTSIVLWVKGENQTQARRVELKRDEISVESVESQLLAKNVGYIKLKQFSGNTSTDARKAMDELRAKGVKSWVLDLRSNPGGLLEQAIQISDLFLDKGTIVTTEAAGGKEREARRAKSKSNDLKDPVVVLVNTNSASASEIVAGALKNLDRALIVGSNTFGKGSVQILYDNDDGSKLKLTIAQYLTPGDRSIQSVGIIPDVELERMFVPKKNDSADDFLRLTKSEHTYREADLAAHLTSSYTITAEKPSYTLRFVHDPPKRDDGTPATDPNEGSADDEDEDLDAPFVEDFEIQLARDLAAGADQANRPGMVRSARRIVDRIAAEQQTKLAQALSTLGVDWSAAPAGVAGAAQLQAGFALDAAGGKLRAGEVVKITGTISNHGTVPAFQVIARVKSDDRVFDETELVFGKIDPGQTRTWTEQIRVPADAADRLSVLGFDVREQRGARAAVQPLKLRIEAADQPVFAYTHQLIDEGNGDGLVQKREHYKLRITVKNIGTGVAAKTSASLRNASGDGVVINKGRFELGKMNPGDQKSFDFTFDVNSDFDADDLYIEMGVYDEVLNESTGEKLKYHVADGGSGPAPASGSATVSRDSAAIREGASEKSDIVAFADKGSAFKLLGRQGSWLQIELESGRPGFIAENDARKSSDTPHPSFRPSWQVTPPTLSLRIPTYETTSDSYTLEGKATDETRIEDVFVFVSNRESKIDNR
ncbi:MAG TPA: MXAN_5808 family serine peptidase, partial [Kofleriaceae bacterium]|nr:MXAN_5808 family serine peptidase [Kofleriaceae bacterium]